jgi:hypothetical protein
MEETRRELTTSETLTLMWQISLEHPDPPFDKLIGFVEARIGRKITVQEKSKLHKLCSNSDFYAQTFDSHSLAE